MFRLVQMWMQGLLRAKLLLCTLSATIVLKLQKFYWTKMLTSMPLTEMVTQPFIMEHKTTLLKACTNFFHSHCFQINWLELVVSYIAKCWRTRRVRNLPWLFGACFVAMIPCLFFRRLLLERKADITRKCRRGRTPLQDAPKDSEAAKLLVCSASPAPQIHILHLCFDPSSLVLPFFSDIQAKHGKWKYLFICCTGFTNWFRNKVCQVCLMACTADNSWSSRSLIQKNLVLNLNTGGKLGDAGVGNCNAARGTS